MIEVNIKEYKYPNGVLALKDIRVKIEGTCFIMGKTGCGKSTLLKTFNGLIPDFYGGMLIGSVRVFSEKPSPKIAYMVMQNPREQITSLRVLDEIAFPIAQEGVSYGEAKRIAEDVAEQFGIGHLLDRNIYEISFGELQLVEIAAAVASGKRIILFDEPFAHLSKKNIMKLISIIKDLNVVVSDHRIEFSKYFDEIFNMGLEIKKFNKMKTDLGDVIYDGLIEIRKREIIAVIGDNGSGKTTLLKRIARDLKRQRMDFQLVLQNPNYHFTENRVFDEVRNEKILMEFDLVELKDRHPHSLSGGESKRLSIAKAFNKEILLLDEPTAGQDVNFREKLIYLLRKYCKTAIIATHDEKLAEKCDRIIKL